MATQNYRNGGAVPVSFRDCVFDKLNMPSKLLRLTFPFLMCLHLGSAAAASNEPASCLADLEEIAKFLPANDTGAGAELADHGAAIESAFRKARADAAQAVDGTACEAVLRAYLKSWRPGHLALASGDPASVFGPAPSAKGKDEARPAADPRAPAFKVLDKQTVMLSFGTFDGRYKPAVEALLAAHRAELESHKHWIIDVRNNNGGSDSTYAPLLPWLMDTAYVAYNMEWLATPANARAQGEICQLLGDRETCEKDLAPIARAMQAAAPGSYVAGGGERVEYRYPEQTEAHQPARVAVLVDRACGSSCEQFLLAVRGSFKVKLLGRPSRGSLDYSNMRPYRLPSGQRTLFYAISRSMRLPLMPVDQTGIQPDVLLPKPADDAAREAEVMQAQRWLAGETPASK
jgi:hypothetical protein